MKIKYAKVKVVHEPAQEPGSADLHYVQVSQVVNLQTGPSAREKPLRCLQSKKVALGQCSLCNIQICH